MLVYFCFGCQEDQSSISWERMSSESLSSWAPFWCVACAVAVGSVGVVVAIGVVVLMLKSLTKSLVPQ